KMLDERTQMVGWEIADAVASSPLPKETKRALFERAAEHKVLSFRQDAISHLRDLDPAKALQLLIAELDKVPVTPEGSYWGCAEVRFAHFVRNWSEPTAWAALEKTAMRVDVGLRMELLSNGARSDVPEAGRKAALRFVSKFLNDSEVRVAAGPKYEGPYAGFHGFDRIEVRNFAAHQAACLLKMDVDPKPSWTDKDWAELRKDVAKAMDREGIR